MTTATANPHEATARIRKAHAICEVLAAHGATADEAAALPPAGQRIAADLAGVRPASEATWACVVALLRVGEAAEKRKLQAEVHAEEWAALSRARWLT